MVFEPKSSTELTGVYAWFRPGSTSVYYPDGFQESGSISGSLLPPVATPPVLQGDQAGIITVQLSGGGLTTAIDETGQPLPNGKIAWSTSNDMNLTLTVGPTGKLTGSFVDPATGKKRLLEGIWLPKLQLGGGFFLGDSSAGALSLSGQ
jgi:hypothetical protein